MKNSKEPTKEQIREWLTRRYLNREPLPEIKQIQDELNWTVPSRLHGALRFS